MKIKPILKKYPIISAFAISGMISIVVFILILLLAFEIIVLIYPSQEVLHDGRILRYQPFAQLFGSVIISAIISIAIFIIGCLKFINMFEKYQ